MIIIGLYSFLWGKGKEIKEQQQQVPTNTEADQSKITYPKSNGEVRIMLDTQTMQIVEIARYNKGLYLDYYRLELSRLFIDEVYVDSSIVNRERQEGECSLAISLCIHGR